MNAHQPGICESCHGEGSRRGLICVRCGGTGLTPYSPDKRRRALAMLADGATEAQIAQSLRMSINIVRRVISEESK